MSENPYFWQDDPCIPELTAAMIIWIWAAQTGATDIYSKTEEGLTGPIHLWGFH